MAGVMIGGPLRKSKFGGPLRKIPGGVLVVNGKTGPKEVKHPPKRSSPDPILRVCALCGFSNAGRRAI